MLPGYTHQAEHRYNNKVVTVMCNSADGIINYFKQAYTKINQSGEVDQIFKIGGKNYTFEELKYSHEQNKGKSVKAQKAKKIRESYQY